MTGLKDFSTDAAANNTAAPPILWSEGQPARSINDSARAMMAALACWHNDNTGNLQATGGAANAYSVQTAQVFTAADYARSFSLVIFVDAANTGPTTLSPDGAGARPWQRLPGVDHAPGDLAVGPGYRVRWQPAVGAFITDSPTIERPGRIAPFSAVAAVPAGWVICDGRALSRVSHAALFAVIGGTWGVPDAATFSAPDFRGRTLFGADSGANRLTGSGGLGGGLSATGGSEAVQLSVEQMPSHGHAATTGGAGAHDHGGNVTVNGQHSHGGSTGNAGAHGHTGTTGGGGSHSHSGTTGVSGSHTHNQGYTKLPIYGSGGSLTAVSEMFPPSAGNSIASSDGGGEHQHPFSTDPVGDHAHNFATNGVGDHAHAIGADGNHNHAIPPEPGHVHSVNVTAIGGGGSHSNIPPAAVVIWAIKG